MSSDVKVTIQLQGSCASYLNCKSGPWSWLPCRKYKATFVILQINTRVVQKHFSNIGSTAKDGFEEEDPTPMNLDKEPKNHQAAFVIYAIVSMMNGPLTKSLPWDIEICHSSLFWLLKSLFLAAAGLFLLQIGRRKCVEETDFRQ
jgi:hypothetical protein